MTILLVQIFVLMLAAFLAGAMAACLVRRANLRKTAEIPAGSTPVPPSSGGPAPDSERTSRFDRALTGNAEAAVPPPFQAASRPMIEVQPAPAPPAPNIPTPPQRLAVPATPPAAPPPAAPSRRASRFAALSEPSQAAPSQGAGPSAAPASRAPDAPPSLSPSEPSRPAAPQQTSAPSAPTPPAAAAPTEERPPDADDLTRIRSICPETQKRLYELGVSKYRDIAAWSPGDVSRVSQTLGHPGRIEEENWVEQAQILAKGGDPGTARKTAEPQPEAAPLASPGADRLHRIIGIDAETETLLIASGVTRFAQIAGWTSSDIEKIENLLGRPGRVGLENWIGQAKILSRGANGEQVAAVAPSAMQSEAAADAAVPSRPVTRSEIGGLRSVRSAALRSEQIGAIAPAIGIFDDLKRIRGVGVLIEKKLNSLGITMYEQIANWTGADIDRISQILDFKGRIERESWVEQARILASGGQTDFSRRADRGDADTNRNSRG